VVCSSCGFENPAAMRFCGMCGMPLPQRPITAPGAHSTLNFTRVPVDAKLASQERRTASGDRVGVLLETPATDANGAEIESASKTHPQPPSSTAPPASTVANEPAPKELVPDVPLDEYVQKFHYEPPKDPAEVTMRGDAHVAEPSTKPQVEATANKPPENILASSSAAEVKPPVGAAPVASTEDVDARLGLEPESASEARIARPRFLDINEPPREATENKNDKPKEVVPANSGTSTIAGPSFLGLNDAPQTWIQAVGVDEEYGRPRNSHWRAWLAVAVVLVIAALGVLEWRAQTTQTNNGPIEVVRTKFHDWRTAVEARYDGQPAPAGGDANSKPEMQVQEQPKPADQQQGGSDTAGNATAPQPAGSPADQMANNSAGQSTGAQPGAPPAASPNPPAAKPGGAESSDSAKAPPANQKKTAAADNSQATAEAAAPEKPKVKRSTDAGDGQEVTTKQIAPGADELTKANNASDAAATAAWLWKSTAKGNPEAPVRLADMYIQGEGVPRSCEQAMVLLKTAAEKENAPARNRLASMYATGTCVQRNRVEAYRWLSSALTANPNSQWAQQNRDLIWQQMTPEERNQAQKYR